MYASSWLLSDSTAWIGQRRKNDVFFSSFIFPKYSNFNAPNLILNLKIVTFSQLTLTKPN